MSKEKKSITKKEKKKSPASKSKADKKTSANDQEQAKEFKYDRLESYPINKALEIVKNLAKEKFDSSIEAHFRLGIDAKKGDQQIRSAVSLPHGTGKTVKVAAFVTEEKEKEVKKAGADLVGGEDLIAKIKKTEKTDFQVAVAEPAIMKNLSQIAKILGTRGLMPSPKNETVTTDPAKSVLELKKGKISFKNDDTGNIHVAIGKVSFDVEKLTENYQAIEAIIKKLKPAKTKGIYIKNISVCSAMGPGVKVIISK